MPKDEKLLPVIGSFTEVDFPDFGLLDVPAKIDTGADSSSLWVSNLREENKALYFVFFGEGHPLYTGKEHHVKDFKMTIIRNSSGDREVRYKIRFNISIENKEMKTWFTLADRSKNRYPILIGRKTLTKRFMVDVSDGRPRGNYVEANSIFRQLLKDEHLRDEADRLRVGVLSRGSGNYSTKRLLQTLRARGHEAVLVNHAECYVDIEQDNPDVRYRGEDISGLDAIIPRIGTSITRYGSAIVRQFEMMGVFTTARSIAIERSRNKLRSLQLLSRSGVGIPKTIFSRETESLDDLMNQIGTPMVIKVAQGTHGRGVILAESRKVAKSVIQAFYVENVSILLQEFIEEAAGEDVRALVVGGKVVAAMERKSVGDDFRSNLHMGGESRLIKLTAAERRTALKAAKAMGLDICGVDILRSKRGPLVLEVNSSPGLHGIEDATGINVAGRIVDFVEANARRKRSKDKVGA